MGFFRVLTILCLTRPSERDRPTPTTSSVQSSLGSNKGHNNTDTSNANSPQSSPYTPLLTIIPALTSPPPILPTPTPTRVDKNPHVFSEQRVYSQPQAEAVLGTPTSAIRGE